MSLARESTFTHIRARAAHRLRPKDVAKVLCHRQREGVTQFLVLWLTKGYPLIPPRSVASWHSLDELSACLHFVQAYLEDLPPRNDCQTPLALKREPSASGSLKRKQNGTNLAHSARGSDAIASTSSGLLTPIPSHLSRTPSVSSSTSSDSDWLQVDVYNAILQRREGWIRAKPARKSATGSINLIDASKLPTPEMLEHVALNLNVVKAAESAIRYAFLEKLRHVDDLHLENDVDDTTPSINFEFIPDYVIQKGITRLDPDAHEGCQLPCKPDMGAQRGCEYTALCGCLEFAAVDEQRLQRTAPEDYKEYRRMVDAGYIVDTIGLPKKFPYKVASAAVPSVLQSFYREQRFGRYPIYECNANCNCGPNCKSRLVQRGRKVGLTVFKTPDRGWGVKCNERLVAGEFIDTYRGEVITNDEAARREQALDEKASYLYSLDKFVGDEYDLTEKTCHVVDGQYKGNLTRFINHSCDPNCRMYTVSYNKHDLRIYDLAFFAYEDIPAGVELTFDYMDKDEEEEEDVFRKRVEKAREPGSDEKKRCNCGARKCRWFLWE